MVIWLIVINVAVFLLDALSQNWRPGFSTLTFGLSLDGLRAMEFWQPVTYMFMHGGIWHLVFNMIGLYIFGTEFERVFGQQRFLQFYIVCGVLGGLAYMILSWVDPYYAGIPLVGASGAIFGLLIAAMIFFPNIQVILVFFPIPVRVFGMIVLAIALLTILSPGVGSNRGGELCHAAGALAGVGMFYAWGVMPRVRLGFGRGLTILPGSDDLRARKGKGAWHRKQQDLAKEQAEVDRILAKVHDEGLASLTRKEKKTLAQATRR